mmetsp:Transcript_21202/g.29705  ORF Transcript_21202/g.29705 Transcript_21202/m.29705 type:complete len:216 (+) Transcript_21202:70-717(+)
MYIPKVSNYRPFQSDMIEKIKLLTRYDVGHIKTRRSIAYAKPSRCGGKVHSIPTNEVASSSETLQRDEKILSDPRRGRMKKKVDFDAKLSVRYVEGISEYSDEEKFSSWYTKKDIHEWKSNATSKLRGVPQTETDNCTRGIEVYQNIDTYLRNRECKKSYIKLFVNYHQRASSFNLIHKKNKDLNLLKLASKNSMEKAQRIGQCDEVVAMEIHIE